MNGKNSHNFRVFTNFLAFLVLVCIAIILIISKIGIFSNITAILNNIAKISAYFLVGMASFWYAISKRGAILKVLWLASVVVIIVTMFI